MSKGIPLFSFRSLKVKKDLPQGSPTSVRVACARKGRLRPQGSPAPARVAYVRKGRLRS